ncbi:tyrosine-type recombinase/integrase [Micromonospora andamanensis]|uniref:tyrosine-type recombinase/integrase n=2 Tax=Micromonospora andamanensis TaxID=1287068 RepID=UPI00194F2C72|nr:site-specific integrase [Micromonospora andamanensis]GIJ42846.1 site-specific integrase [Micromonospora andamanensis]
MSGSTYKRCRCRNEAGRELGAKCPSLRRKDGAWNPRHGQWYFRAELPVVHGAQRKVMKRGGYATQTEADSVRQQIELLLAIPEAGVTGDQARQDILTAIGRAFTKKQPLPNYDETRRRFQSGQIINGDMLVGQGLDEWLTGRKIAKGTRRSYAAHIRLYLKPHLGHLPIDRLRRVHISTMFDEIDADNEFIRAARVSGDPEQRRKVKGRRIVGAATKQRIRATLRAAINHWIREQMITINPARLVELESGKRPKALMWTDARVEAWKENRARRAAAMLELGAARERHDVSAVHRLLVEIDHLDTTERPSPVMVWTAEQTGYFLDFIHNDRLYPLYHLIAYRGPRRGEACGSRWVDLNKRAHTLKITEQLVQLGWKVESGSPKSEAGGRDLTLDEITLKVIDAWRKRQIAERLAWGGAWINSGRIFTHQDGSALHPADVTKHFNELVAASGLPPIRLHDLRHGAATLALEGGVDIKVVQEELGHSTSTLTRDTYTSVSPRLAREAAEKIAGIVPRAIEAVSDEVATGTDGLPSVPRSPRTTKRVDPK